MINYFKIGTNITYRNLRQKIVLEQCIIRCCYSTRKFIPKIMVNRKVLNVTTTPPSYKNHDDPNCIDPKSRKIHPNEDNRNQTVLKTTNCSQQIGNWDGKRLCTSKSSSQEPPAPPPPPSSSNRSKILMCLLILGATAGGIALAYNKKRNGSNVIIIENVVKKKKKEPASAEDIPKQIPYLLIGGGTASFSAFRAIKSNDPKAKVMVISNEYETPYMRPPLSKELWFNNSDSNGTDVLRFKQWNGVERSLYYEPNDFYVDANKLLEEPNGGVTIIKGYTVKRIDAYNRKVILTDGTEIEYHECLLATGSIPKSLDVFNAAPLTVKENVSVYKTIEDFERLKYIVDKKKSIAIVGGGFLGSELACALVKYGESKKLKVFQVFHEDGNMGKVLPKYLSQWTSDRVREEGVCVIPNVQITSVGSFGGQIKLSLINGEELLVDHVVVAVGSKPNIDIAKESDLEIDSNLGGFVVNAELEARGHLYVAGDAACFYDPKLGRRRVEHHDHAVVSGRLAGENMVGQNKPYKHQSMFWSDLGPKVGYEAIGLVDSALETVGVFAISKPNDDTPKEVNRHDITLNETNNESEPIKIQQEQPPPSSSSSPTVTENFQISDNPNGETNKKQQQQGDNDDFGKGIIFYLRDNEVVGIVLWNVFNRINVARKIIGGKYDDLNEVAKLFDIHE